MKSGTSVLPPEVVEKLPLIKRAATVRLIVALGIFMDKSGKCWPSIALLREKTGIGSKTTMCRAIKEAEQLGIIRRKKRRRALGGYEVVTTWGHKTDGTAARPSDEGAMVQPLDRCDGTAVDTFDGTAARPRTPQELPIELPNSSGKAKELCPNKILKNLFLYEKDEKLKKRLPESLTAWQAAYPDVDIPGEIRRAHAWEISNPKRRKSNHARFLNNWLRRAQDDLKGNRDNGQSRKIGGRTFEAQDDPEQVGKFDGR